MKRLNLFTKLLTTIIAFTFLAVACGEKKEGVSPKERRSKKRKVNLIAVLRWNLKRWRSISAR